MIIKNKRYLRLLSLQQRKRLYGAAFILETPRSTVWAVYETRKYLGDAVFIYSTLQSASVAYIRDLETLILNGLQCQLFSSFFKIIGAAVLSFWTPFYSTSGLIPYDQNE